MTLFIFGLITRLVKFEDSFTLCIQDIQFEALTLLSSKALKLQELIRSDWLLFSCFGCGVLELSREQRLVSYVNRYRVSNTRLVGGFKPTYDRAEPV